MTYSEGWSGADGLSREIDAESEYEEGRHQRNGLADATQPRTGRHAIKSAAGGDDHQPDATHHGGHAESECHDQHEPEARAPGGDRAEQDQQGARGRDEATGKAEHEQAAPGDR